MAYEIKGTLHHIGETQQVSDRFCKREIVLLVPDGKYPQHVPLQLTGDRTSLADDLRIGDELRVTFNVRGRESNKNGQVRYWLNLDVWKLERTGERSADHSRSAPSDDLPF